MKRVWRNGRTAAAAAAAATAATALRRHWMATTVFCWVVVVATKMKNNVASSSSHRRAPSFLLVPHAAALRKSMRPRKRTMVQSQPEDPKEANSKEAIDNNNAATIVNGIIPELDSKTMDYQFRFGGVGRLYAGKQSSSQEVDRSKQQQQQGSSISQADLVLDRLHQAVVVVIGLGGVGSWAAEALCRSGVGSLVLMDLDDICMSNANRQIHALTATAGQLKIEALRDRFVQINPACRIHLVPDFVTENNVDSMFELVRCQLDGPSTGSRITAVLDAIDGAKEKAAILSYCDTHKFPVVTCGGAAGRSDPTRVARTDLTLVNGDKLLASCKKELRKQHGFAAGLPFRELQKGRRTKKWNIECVYSEEDSIVVADDPGRSSFRRCDGALGTACFLTGTFGFVAAAAIVDQIANDKLMVPRGRR